MDALRVRRSCLRTTCWCQGCRRSHALEDLVPLLEAAQVTELQQAIGDHLSDRV